VSITRPLKTMTDPLKEIKIIITDPKRFQAKFLLVLKGTIAQLFTKKKIPTSQSL